jgi:hypothetical protein
MVEALRATPSPAVVGRRQLQEKAMANGWIRTVAVWVALAALAGQARCETHFLEAEAWTPSSDGWVVAPSPNASRVAALRGADGDPAGTAQTSVTLAQAGTWRIWVRHIYHSTWRGAFHLAVLSGGVERAGKDFDREARPAVGEFEYVWDSFDVELPAGPIDLRLSKFEQKNCSGYVRLVDCALLTTDLALVPNHLEYGPQTFVRATLGAIYDKPVYVHIFADHYRAPWYGHHYLSKAGAGDGLAPAADSELLKAGEQTPWCNVTRMLYQDSGAILNITIRYTYHQRPERMQARFEFATAPADAAIVRTMDVEARPNGLVVVMPPDLTTAENLARLGRDRDFAERTGQLADAYAWPTLGKKPERFPIFVSAGIGGYGTPPDQAVIDREQKTLDYFGFSNWTRTRLGGGTWRMVNDSYCQPDLPKIQEAAAERAKELAAEGKSAKDVVYSMVMDEPGGQALEFIAANPAYGEAFRTWLKALEVTPQELLVADWQAVRPVTGAQREAFPALYYFSQRFRTRALGDFVATQRRALEAACGGTFPGNVNFSDGATYYANFYGQGVDYFELLDDAGQNSIWGEDWANGSSSYQCSAYNVDLMRAAARERGQVIGHYLISHAGRRPFDVKLKAAGNVARGAKILESFCYGVYWGSHEGGPAWTTHVWQAKPETWGAYAEINREIGGAEDLLLPAMPPPARVAILYSSSTDVWQVEDNLAYGFDRMHTWMALAHAQIPVDFVSEKHVANGLLQDYQVCYLSGPNLTRAAAAKLVDWVRAGGVLALTAGAASRDEYNRPLATFDEILPASRGDLTTAQAFRNSGYYVYILNPQDRVTAGDAALDVLSVKQPLTPRPGAATLGVYQDRSAAWVRGTAGQGTVYCAGFLPALDYIRQAVVARRQVAEQAKQEEQARRAGGDAGKVAGGVAGAALSDTDRARLETSSNPWAYPAAVREAILAPVRAAGVTTPVTCSVPLVDAVCMTCDQGIVIPLANYTLVPQAKVELSVRVDRPVRRLETVHQGQLAFRADAGRIDFVLPLESTDYVKIYY